MIKMGAVGLILISQGYTHFALNPATGTATNTYVSSAQSVALLIDTEITTSALELVSAS